MATNTGHATFVIIISVSVLALTLVSVSMAIRMFTRIVVLKRTGWEDWILCVACVIHLASLAMFPKAASLGLLKPMTSLPLDNIIALGKISYANECLNAPAMAFIKLSILLQMIRIFVPIHQTKSFYFIVIFAVLNTMWFVARFFIAIFQCMPISRVWNPTIRGHCLDMSTSIFASGAVNMVSDCIMFVLPIFWISRLQMDMKRKLTAGAVFVVGLVACTASVVRFIYSYEHYLSGTASGVSSLITVALCTEGELAAGIITANLPTIPAFIKYFKGESRNSRRYPSEESSASGRLRREFDQPKIGGLAVGNPALLHTVKEEESHTPSISIRSLDEKETMPVNNASWNNSPDLEFKTM